MTFVILLWITFITPQSSSPLAVVAALEIADSAVRSMEWTQEVHFIDPDGVRQKMSSSAQWFDERDWGWHGEFGARMPPDDILVYYEAWYRSDGIRMHTYTRASNAGFIREIESARSYRVSPENLLGRWIDPSGQRRLSDLLRIGDDLRLLQDGDLPVLCSDRISLNGYDFSLKVQVDPEHDWLPRRIQVFHPVLPCVIEEIVVTEFAQHDDIWVPVAGTRCLYSPDQDQVIALERELLDGGMPEEEVLKAVAERFATGELKPPPIGDGVLFLEHVDITSLNRAVSEEVRAIPYQEGAQVVDNFTRQTFEFRDGEFHIFIDEEALNDSAGGRK